MRIELIKALGGEFSKLASNDGVLVDRRSINLVKGKVVTGRQNLRGSNARNSILAANGSEAAPTRRISLSRMTALRLAVFSKLEAGHIFPVTSLYFQIFGILRQQRPL